LIHPERMTRPVIGAEIVGRRSIDREQRMGLRLSTITNRERTFVC
jgi:hypothetical protein